MTFAMIRDVVLFALALYGAGLSTYNLIMARRKDKRSIQTSFNTVMATYENGTLGHRFARISAVNMGHRSVTIETIALELPDKARIVATSFDSFVQPDTRLPITLKDGESAHLHIAYADIGSAIAGRGLSKAKIRPVSVDSAGGVHFGPEIEVDTADFQAP